MSHGQFDVEDQGQGHRTLDPLWYKFPYASKVITSTRNCTDDDDADDDRNRRPTGLMHTC